jgi:DNA-binding CsgD family transcriptional regulator
MFAVSPDVRVAMSRRALALSELSSRDRAQHWSRLVYNLVQAGRADESRALMGRAAAEVESAQHPPSSTILMLAQDAHQYVEGHFGESLRLHEAAIRRGFGPDEANREWVARHWRCELLANLDRLDESIELAASGIVAAQRGRQAWAIEFFEIYRGRQLLQRGRIADALVALEGRIEPEHEHQITGALYAAGLVALGRLAIHTADARLRRETAAAAELMRERGTPATRGQATWLLALLAMAQGNREYAVDLVRSADPSRATLLPLFPMDVTDDPQLVRMAVAGGDLALAESAVRAAQRRAEHNPTVAVIAGAADHAAGLLHNDAEQLESACRWLARGPRPLAAASAFEDLARVQLDAGDHAAGIDALDRALILCTDAGATWDASRLRARLRRHGVRRRLLGAHRPATGWASLTASELTVAQLVGQGLSNRDVAARLFVSPHTVSSHLRHVFTKLGVNSRVELARMLSQHGSS